MSKKNPLAENGKLRWLTKGQQHYMEAIDTSVITLCDGPAGSGKSYIAVAKASQYLIEGKFDKIVIARPIVECGENLGFLPGEVKEKIDPYMKPIMDVLDEFFLRSDLTKHLAAETIELCPLAYMRGRTLHNTVMVLDEAQNATMPQLRMFLTRLGQNSKIIVSGDTTQKDLPSHQGDSFRTIVGSFDHAPYIDGIQVVRLTKKDVVRHTIIQKIIERIGE
jgi:phosphate starvation-inducible PhoH-like protein